MSAMQSSGSGTSVEDRVAKLTLEADVHHKQAQTLNREGRFEDAKKAYAAMHASEDEATLLARELTSADVAASPANTIRDDVYTATHSVYMLPTLPDGAPGPQELRDRLLGCVVGSLVADAAAMGVHWVYDLDKLTAFEEQAAARGVHSLAFYEPPQSPFYSYESGRNSPYGEQTLALLESLADSKGLDCTQYAATLQRRLGVPGYDGYLDVSAKGFLRNHGAGRLPPDTGADDAQANCTARLAPLLVAYAGDARLVPCVVAATRGTQNTDAAAAWGGAGAAVLEAILLGAAPSAAVEATVAELESGVGRLQYMKELGPEIASHLRRAAELAPQTPSEACAALGRNCHMPTALQTPLHVVLHVEYLAVKEEAQGGGAAVPPVSRLPSHWYRTGVEMAVREGGCSGSRASFAGACLGAMAGMGGLEPGWEPKYAAYGQVLENARKVLDGRL